MRSTLLVIWLVSVASCAQQTHLPTDTYYQLPVPAPVMTRSLPLLQGTLVVERFQTAALHNDRAVVYAEAAHPFELKQYHYHHWADAPSRLLQESLVGYLRSAHAADVVLSAQATVRPDFTLAGKIRRFEQIRRDGRATGVAVELELQLRDHTAGRNILVKDYLREPKVTDPGMSASVAALAAGMGEIYAEFLGDVAAALTPRQPQPTRQDPG